MICRQQIYELATTLFVKEDQPAIRKSLRTCLPRLSRVVLDELSGSPLAFTIVTEYDTGDCAFIAFCGVSPTLQGKGVGSRLLEETLSGIFQSGNYSACCLIVDDWNVGAMRLYLRYGFSPIGIVHEPHSRCILMRLEAPCSPVTGKNISTALDDIEKYQLQIKCRPCDSSSSNPIMYTYLTT
jgi:GNAT superfamily N-acetyltransferase